MRTFTNRLLFYFSIIPATFLLLTGDICAADFSFGARAGMCAAGFWGDDADDMEDLAGQSGGDNWRARLGFCGGGFLLLHVNKVFGIQSELNVIMKGRRFTLEAAGVETISTIKLNYLEIPFLAVVRIPVSNAIVPFGYAGSAFDALLTAKSHVKIDYPENMEQMGFSDTEDTQDIKDDISKVDVGFLFGGGVRFSLSKGALLFDVRFGPGLREIDEDGDSDTKNRAFSFTIGYEI